MKVKDIKNLVGLEASAFNISQLALVKGLDVEAVWEKCSMVRTDSLPEGDLEEPLYIFSGTIKSGTMKSSTVFGTRISVHMCTFLNKEGEKEYQGEYVDILYSSEESSNEERKTSPHFISWGIEDGALTRCQNQ